MFCSAMILINVSFANSVGLLIAYNITHYAQTETTGKSVQYNMSSAILHCISYWPEIQFATLLSNRTVQNVY